jgi:hypothetical protein
MKPKGILADLRDYWQAPATSPQLPIWRQSLEMVLLYLLRRIGPRYYIQARWGRSAIPLRDKWRHLNRAEYLRLVSRLNPAAYQKASQHKLIEKSVLASQHIASPRFIAYLHPLRGRDASGEPVRSVEQLRALLLRHQHQRVCFKLVEGWGGIGFASYLIVPHKDSIQLVLAEGLEPLSIEDWWQRNASKQDGFLLESHLDQHPAMAALNSSSVNTVRMWVLLEGQNCTVLGAYLRIGRRGSQVDNRSGGGIVCPVDVRTGQAHDAYDPAHAGHTLIAHPDSQALLAGFQIPFWNEALGLAGDAIAAFPHMCLAGVDIAVTPTGPSVIELNVVADYLGCARMDLPLKSYLRPDKQAATRR